MIRSMLFLVPLTLLTACGYDEDAFADDYSTAFCDKVVSCEDDIVTAYVELGMDEATAQATYDTTYDASCNTEETEGEDDGESDCEFDKDAAQTCIDDIDAMSCDFFSTGEGFPDACTTVCG